MAAAAASLVAAGPAHAQPDLRTAPPPVVVDIQKNGSLILNGEPVSDEQLGDRLSALSDVEPQPELHIREGSILRSAQVWLMIESGKRFGFRQVRNVMTVRLPPKPPVPPVIVTITDAAITLDGEVVARDDLAERFEAIAKRDPQPEVHFRTERGASYQIVAPVMASAQRAGIKRTGVIGGT